MLSFEKGDLVLILAGDVWIEGKINSIGRNGHSERVYTVFVQKMPGDPSFGGALRNVHNSEVRPAATEKAGGIK